MNILIISGSPKKVGNTTMAVDLLEECLRARGQKSESLRITDFRIAGCLGCNACYGQSKDAPNCIQSDDFDRVFGRMKSADAIVYASPLYSWSFTAQLKAFLDRHYCLMVNPEKPGQTSLLAGRRAALLVLCAGPEDKTDLIQAEFDRACEKLEYTPAGKFVVDWNYAPDLASRARAVTERMAEALVSG